MGYAEKIYETVKQLPEHTAREILDFAEFVATRRLGNAPSITAAEYQKRRSEIERVFAKYKADLTNFKFDREEANARR